MWYALVAIGGLVLGFVVGGFIALALVGGSIEPTRRGRGDGCGDSFDVKG